VERPVDDGLRYSRIPHLFRVSASAGRFRSLRCSPQGCFSGLFSACGERVPEAGLYQGDLSAGITSSRRPCAISWSNCASSSAPLPGSVLPTIGAGRPRTRASTARARRPSPSPRLPPRSARRGEPSAARMRPFARIYSVGTGQPPSRFPGRGSGSSSHLRCPLGSSAACTGNRKPPFAGAFRVGRAGFEPATLGLKVPCSTS
jgi:hypothetical protein